MRLGVAQQQPKRYAQPEVCRRADDDRPAVDRQRRRLTAHRHVERLKARERPGRHVGEGNDYVDQRDPHEEQKRRIRRLAHVLADDLRDARRAVPHAGK
jgi:hypothetical protein